MATAISTVVAMALLDWRLTALSLGLLPFFLYVTFRVGKVRREVSAETQKALAEMSAVTEETLSVSGMLLSKTFGQQAASVTRFRGVNARLARLQIRQAMVGRWFFMIIGTIFSITPAFVYWLAGYLNIQHDPSAPTIGAIVAFTTLQSRLFFPLGQLLSVQVEIQGSLALFDRIFEYLEMDPEIVDSPTAIDPRPEDGSRLRPLPRRLLRLPRVARRSPRHRDRDGGWRCRCRAAGSVGCRGGCRRIAGTGHGPGGRRRANLRPSRPRLRSLAGPARGARGAVGLGQDHHDLPHSAALRRRFRARSRSTVTTSARSRWRRSARRSGS